MKSSENPTEESARGGSVDICDSCQGTGLVLPQGNIKFKSQATQTCPDCNGSGRVVGE